MNQIANPAIARMITTPTTTPAMAPAPIPPGTAGGEYPIGTMVTKSDLSDGITCESEKLARS